VRGTSAAAAGFATSGLQLSDVLGTALGTGTGGALVAVLAGDAAGGGATAIGVAAAFAAGALVGAHGLALSGRLVARSRGQGVASLR